MVLLLQGQDILTRICSTASRGQAVPSSAGYPFILPRASLSAHHRLIRCSEPAFIPEAYALVEANGSIVVEMRLRPDDRRTPFLSVGDACMCKSTPDASTAVAGMNRQTHKPPL